MTNYVFGIVLFEDLAVVLRLIGLISLLALVIMINVLMIIGLLVWNKQGDAKSVFARRSETA